MRQVIKIDTDNNEIIGDSEEVYTIVVSDGCGNFALEMDGQTYLANQTEIWIAQAGQTFSVNCQDEFISNGYSWVTNDQEV